MTNANGWYSEEAATFGDRLAGAREATGLTQRALASRLGVKTATIAGWENDFGEPRSNRLQMLSGILGVSLSWLLTGEGEGPEAPDDVNSLPNDVSALLTEMRTLRAEMRQSVEKFGQLEKRLRATLKEQT